MQQNIRVKQEVTDLKYSADGSKIKTDMGYLKIQTTFDETYPSSLNTKANIGLADGRWVTLQQKNIIWLLPEYRPICSVTLETHPDGSQFSKSVSSKMLIYLADDTC